MMKKKNVIFIIFSLSTSLILLSILELLANIIYTPNRLDQILAIIEPHKERFWRGKPNYIGDFFGEKVKHNNLGLRANNTSKADILIMGASPSYGWGVPENKTYGKIIESNLKIKDFKTYNGSNIGYSSFQGNLLLPQLLKEQKPKFVIISYVINDVDRYRFFKSSLDHDKDVDRNDKSESILSSYYSKYTLPKLLLSLTSKEETLPRPGKTRVTLDDYISNYKSMINKVKVSGAIPIILKMPVMLHQGEVKKEFLSTIQNSNCKHKDIRILYDCLSEKDLLSDFEGMNEMRKYIAINSSRMVENYQIALTDFAKSENIAIVDGMKTFLNSKEYLYLDKKEDPIHPNIKGHQVLGDLLTRKILNILNSK